MKFKIQTYIIIMGPGVVRSGVHYLCYHHSGARVVSLGIPGKTHFDINFGIIIVMPEKNFGIHYNNNTGFATMPVVTFLRLKQ